MTSAPYMVTRNQIERKAFETLQAAGVEGELPVPLEKIAAYLGYQSVGFRPGPLDADAAKVSGMIDYSARKIFVNASESLARQRFTLAHELGHAVLHENTGSKIVDFRADLDNPAPGKESDANQFAAALLMPREAFIEQWLINKCDVDALARVFGVSRQTAEIRCKSTVKP